MTADPLTLALDLAQSLEARGISYAIGGALAYGLWGVPRATVDIDLNAFVTAEHLDPVFAVLEERGAQVDRPAARRAAADEGMFEAWLQGYRVDVFVPSIDFSWEAEQTRVRQLVAGTEAWFLSAEALAVFKLLFFRSKDLVDLERLVAVQGDRLQHAWVRRHLVAMMSEADPRVAAWDDLIRRLMPAPR